MGHQSCTSSQPQRSKSAMDNLCWLDIVGWRLHDVIALRDIRIRVHSASLSAVGIPACRLMRNRCLSSSDTDQIQAGVSTVIFTRSIAGSSSAASRAIQAGRGGSGPPRRPPRRQQQRQGVPGQPSSGLRMSRRADYKKMVGTATKLVEAGVIEEPKWLEAVRRRALLPRRGCIEPSQCKIPRCSDCITLFTTQYADSPPRNLVTPPIPPKRTQNALALGALGWSQLQHCHDICHTACPACAPPAEAEMGLSPSQPPQPQRAHSQQWLDLCGSGSPFFTQTGVEVHAAGSHLFSRRQCRNESPKTLSSRRTGSSSPSRTDIPRCSSRSCWPWPPLPSTPSLPVTHNHFRMLDAPPPPPPRRHKQKLEHAARWAAILLRIASIEFCAVIA